MKSNNVSSYGKWVGSTNSIKLFWGGGSIFKSLVYCGQKRNGYSDLPIYDF